MKRVLVFLLLGTLGAAAPPPGQTLAGWDDLRWGMTTAEVLKRHPEARPIVELFAPPPTPDPRMGETGREISDLFEKANRLVLDDPSNAGALYFKTSILDKLFTVSIRFRSGRLSSVTLIGQSPDAELAAGVARTLATKYGPSTKTGEGLSVWRLPKTKIEMTVSKKAGDESTTVQIVYSDTSGGNAKGNL